MEEDQDFDEDEIVFGQTIMNKGDKFTWTFKIYNTLLNCADLQIGIIDSKMLQLDQPVSDFSDEIWNGWSLSLSDMYGKQFR